MSQDDSVLELSSTVRNGCAEKDTVQFERTSRSFRLLRPTTLASLIKAKRSRSQRSPSSHASPPPAVTPETPATPASAAPAATVAAALDALASPSPPATLAPPTTLAPPPTPATAPATPATAPATPATDATPDTPSNAVVAVSAPPQTCTDICPATPDFKGITQTNHVKGNAIVTIVLVEAKGLPGPPADGASHDVYCEFRLGSESFKSRAAHRARRPAWGQRFKLHWGKSSLLQITLWDKGKQKNFMGSCMVDLAQLEAERAHEVWQELDDGYGAVHFSLSVCAAGRAPPPAAVARPLGEGDTYAWYNLRGGAVGQLHVRVRGARGLAGRPRAYCVLELDNERVQTHAHAASAEPSWGKDYMFNVYDVTSTLDVKVYDNSLFQHGLLGRVSVPLLRVRAAPVSRWYALKDRNKRHPAKGNCPRVLLETNIVWSPVRAALRMFRPKEARYVKKPKKFNVNLVYNNVLFVKQTFDLLLAVNESIKRVFEWESRERSALALAAWLLFWWAARPWLFPLLLLAPFLLAPVARPPDEPADNRRRMSDDEGETYTLKNGKSIGSLQGLQGLPELTLAITNGIEYMASVAERLNNLVQFKVPFLSYMTVALLLGAAAVLYAVPFNYIMMTFGVYKFLRKQLNPNRELNNDLIDFINHLPDDDDIQKDWRELNVPEPPPPAPVPAPATAGDDNKLAVVRSYSSFS